MLEIGTKVWVHGPVYDPQIVNVRECDQPRRGEIDRLARGGAFFRDIDTRDEYWAHAKQFTERTEKQSETGDK